MQGNVISLLINYWKFFFTYITDAHNILKPQVYMRNALRIPGLCIFVYYEVLWHVVKIVFGIVFSGNRYAELRMINIWYKPTLRSYKDRLK